MGKETLIQLGEVSKRVGNYLKNGEKNEALDLIERSFGTVARTIFTNIIEHSYFTLDELARKINEMAKKMEHLAERMEKREKIAKRKKEEATIEAAISAAKTVKALTSMMTARQELFEKKIDEIEQLKLALLRRKKELEEQKKQTKDIEERSRIEAKIKAIEKGRRKLHEERKKLEKLRKQNRERNYAESSSSPQSAVRISSSTSQYQSGDNLQSSVQTQRG